MDDTPRTPPQSTPKDIDPRDDILGRARVRDNDELERYYNTLGEHDTGALWTVANDIEPWEPTPSSAPVLWRHEELKPHILAALDLVRPEDAGRRVVYLRNPKRKDVSACCGWLFSGIQVMRPGEAASAHRHAASALRFIMHGSGAYTIVDGHRLDLRHRDFVLTPNGTWHEHGIHEHGETSYWQDGLDIPLTNALEANFYEVHPDDFQKVERVTNDSPLIWGGGPCLLPARETWDKPYSPLFRYGFDESYEALVKYSQATDGDPFDDVFLAYVNPLTGGPVMQTMGGALQMLRPGIRTKAHRHTGNVIYQVAKGSGYSIIGGKRYDWTEKDIFCVPTWIWHEHANASASEDAVLFQFNDLPVMHKLGFYAEQAYPENDGHQPIDG